MYLMKMKNLTAALTKFPLALTLSKYARVPAFFLQDPPPSSITKTPAIP